MNKKENCCCAEAGDEASVKKTQTMDTMGASCSASGSAGGTVNELASVGKKRMRSEEEKKALVTRLNRIEGQVRGISKMIENDEYCIDVLTQVSAAQAALSALARVMLDSHIHHCVVNGVKSGDDEVIDELMNTLQKFMK
jgi:DNA-binding FrmR family transcriptional regulator